MNDAEWKACAETFARLGGIADAALDPQSAQLAADVHHNVLKAIFGVYPTVFQADASYPQFVSNLNSIWPAAATNPDTMYSGAKIDGQGVYRISGRRGSVRYADFQPSLLRRATDAPGPALAPVKINDLTVDKNGLFSFIWSAERPKGYDGDWYHLDPGVGQILVRQVAYDWVNEVDASFAIERLDVHESKPRLTPSEIYGNFQQVLGAGEQRARLFMSWIDVLKTKGAVNRVERANYGAMGGIKGQEYYEAICEIEADEALVVESRIPQECFYWSIHLWDLLFNSIDYMHRQSSLNGHTAYVTPDGMAQVVVSEQDPGVQNWLDIRDFRHQAGVTWRWMDCPDGAPPTIRKVKLAALRDELAPGTPEFSAQQRFEQRSARARGAQLRRKW